LDGQSNQCRSTGKNIRRKVTRKNIVRRRNEWIGHIMRHKGLLKLIIEGRVEGIRNKGRPRLEYIHQIIKD